jgi:hypothetical protein
MGASAAQKIMPETRRFPPPWIFEDHNDACFIVKDANGANIAYVYYERTAHCRQFNDPRRGAAASCQYRQAAGAAAAKRTGSGIRTRMVITDRVGLGRI